MKKYQFMLLLLLSCSGTTFAQDGPFVTYAGGQVLVTLIKYQYGFLQAQTSSYAYKAGLTLPVIPQGHPEWSFSVKLRDTLTNDPVSYAIRGKCLFISDIEGEFANFRKLLLAAGVINQTYEWTYGTGSLIIPGDLFDRGTDVVPELWLLYKLEDEAKAAGGSCQVILGNHDIMNLSGDHRYTDAKYFKEAWLLGTDINGLFGKDTELGRWLRSKNVIEKCGDVLVMHGGMSPAILQKSYSLEQLNDLTRPWYDAAWKSIPDSLQLLFGNDALFWYRGYFMGQKATMGEIDNTLRQYNCKYILVGHTIVKWNIASYYGGKVIGIDVDEHTNHTEGALLENNKWYTIDADGKIEPLIYDPANDNVSEKDIE